MSWVESLTYQNTETGSPETNYYGQKIRDREFGHSSVVFLPQQLFFWADIVFAVIEGRWQNSGLGASTTRLVESAFYLNRENAVSEFRRTGI